MSHSLFRYPSSMLMEHSLFFVHPQETNLEPSLLYFLGFARRSWHILERAGRKEGQSSSRKGNREHVVEGSSSRLEDEEAQHNDAKEEKSIIVKDRESDGLALSHKVLLLLLVGMTFFLVFVRLDGDEAFTMGGKSCLEPVSDVMISQSENERAAQGNRRKKRDVDLQIQTKEGVEEIKRNECEGQCRREVNGQLLGRGTMILLELGENVVGFLFGHH